MEEKHLVTKISQKALLQRDNKILMILDNDGKWELPGGRLNEGEEPKAGLLREIKEELGCDVRITGIADAFLLPTSSGGSKLVLVYSCELVDDQTLTPQPEEVVDYRWLSKDDLAQLPTYEPYKLLINNIAN